LKLNTDRHEASHGLSATAELLDTTGSEHSTVLQTSVYCKQVMTGTADLTLCRAIR